MAGERNQNSKSLTKLAWQRLKRNRLAVLGMSMIGFGVLIAILGSNIRPDFTVDANDQIRPIPRKAPGFTVMMLNERKNSVVEETGFFGRLFFGGTENPYKPYPFWGELSFDGTVVSFEEYNGQNEEAPGNIEHKSICDILYPIVQDSTYVPDGNGNISFWVITDDGGTEYITRSVKEMQDEVLAEHVDERTFWLGTDSLGRDYLSRLMAGTIVSLMVGLISVFISLVIGISLGALAGYFRGWIDDLIMWLINVVWSIPTLLLIIAITVALGKGIGVVFLAVGLTMWVEVARVVRGQVLSIREKEFIEAGKALGFGHIRMIFRHVLPNVMGPVIVISAANFASAILIEAGLSFLGIGAQIPMASWGAMINENRVYVTGIDGSSDMAYLAILPGITIMLMVLAFMLVGNGLRDALDTRAMDEVRSSEEPQVAGA